LVIAKNFGKNRKTSLDSQEKSRPSAIKRCEKNEHSRENLYILHTFSNVKILRKLH